MIYTFGILKENEFINIRLIEGKCRLLKRGKKMNNVNDLLVISSLILHLVHHKELTERQFNLLILEKGLHKERVHRITFILRDLKMIELESIEENQHIFYNHPDETQLSIKEK